MTDYRIRVATAADVPAIVALWNASGLHVYPQTPVGPELEAILARNPDGYLLAEDDSGLIGSVIGTFDGRRGWIAKLCTRPDRRGRGIARALMAHAQRVLAGQGARKVNLLVERDNAEVIGFYRAIGFRVRDTIFLDRFVDDSATER